MYIIQHIPTGILNTQKRHPPDMEGKFKHQQTKVIFRQGWIIKFQECPMLQL